MKKAILLTALLFIGMVSMAQNFLGQSLESAKQQLDKTDLYYTEFINSTGSYTLKFDKDGETRIYIFEYDNKCSNYYIAFADVEKVYNYGKIFYNLGWKRVKGNLDVSTSVKWEYKNGSVQAVCFYQEDEELYVISVK